MFEKILTIINTIDHIPCHPGVKAAITDFLASGPAKDLGRNRTLAELISYDPTLSIEFLRIANADSYGFRNKISTIENSLMILDDELIRLKLEQHPFIPHLKKFDNRIRSEIATMIKHAIEIRIIVQGFIDRFLRGRLIGDDQRNELLCAASLHDIGLIFLLIYFPERFDEIYDRIRASHTLSPKSSSHGAVPDHSLISALLCHRWNLPETIISAIAFHHQPWLGGEQHRLFSEILYLADNISFTYYSIFFDSGDMFSMEDHIATQGALLDIIEQRGIDFSALVALRMEAQEQAARVYTELGI